MENYEKRIHFVMTGDRTYHVKRSLARTRIPVKMEVKNFTGEENQKTIVQSLCSEELTGKAHNHLIFLSALNIFLSITAFLENSLIQVALHRESSLHPPSKLLYPVASCWISVVN